MTSDNANEDFTPGLGNIPPAALDDYGPARRRRWPWIVGFVVIALAGLVAFGPALLSTRWLNARVRSYLNETLQDGTAVGFERLEVSWGEGIRLTDLEIRRAESDAHPLLSAPLVEFDADVLPLLVRRLDVRMFVFHDPVVRIERTREGTLNTEDVVRTQRAKKKRKDGGEDEAVVLPRIDVPIEVHGLTLEIVGDDGRVVRRGGIEFAGHIKTRQGWTRFDLDVPVGAGSLAVDGELTLFDDDGVLLPMDGISASTVVVLDALDARANQDLLSLFIDEFPTDGVLDGKITVDSVGKNASGDVQLTVRNLSVGETARPAGDHEDLRITGSFTTDGSSFEVRRGLIRAPGLETTIDVSGTRAAIEGAARVEADLDRSAAAWRAMGVDVPQGIAGRIEGSLTFGGSRHTGRLTATDVRAPAAVPGGAPFVLDRADGELLVLSDEGAFTVEKATLTLPDEMDLGVQGRVAHDGSVDLTLTLRSLVPAVMQRAKAMGLVPQDIAIAGTLGGKLRVTRATDDDGALLTIEELALRDEGVLIQAKGTAHTSGTVHLAVDGEGALESLLAASGADSQLRGVRGTFAFAASADGPADALSAKLESLRLDGDLALAASGAMRPDGRIEGSATLDGRIPDAVAVARGLGLVAGDVPLDGRIHGVVELGGSRERPEVPRATLRIDDGPLDVNVSGSVSEIGTLQANVEVLAQIDALLRVAHAQGAIARGHAPGGTVRMMAVVAGTRDVPEVPSASLTVSGPLSARADGSYDADGAMHVRVDFSGGLERVAAILAAVQGEDVQSVAGTFEGAASVDGPLDAPQVRLSRLLVRSEGLTVDATAAQRPGGAAELAATVRGPLEGAFAIAHGFGQLMDLSGTGSVDAAVDARIAGTGADRALTGSLSGTLLDLALLRADTPGVVWSDERLTFAVPAFRQSLADSPGGGPERPIQAELRTASGVRLDAQVTGGTGGRPIDLVLDLSGPVQPLLDASAAFTGGGAGLEIEGSIRTTERLTFRGDVAAGRERAADWTGGTVLELTDVVAPYVAISKGSVRAKIAKGVVTLDPIDLAVNGGTAQGTASIGLVGEKPEHALQLTAQNVRIDADLAPLLAHAAPILAVGDAGDAGGRAGLEASVTAKGLDGDRLRRTVSGNGVLHLQGVYAESRNWIGKLLDVAGAGARLEVANADVPFTVKRGKITTENLDMAAAGMDLRVGGQVGTDGTLDYAFGIKPKRDSSSFGKYAKLLDADGYLPLRLEGDLANPDLKLPSLGDAIKGGLGGLLDDVLGRDKDDEEEKKRKEEEERKKRRKERRERKKKEREQQDG